MSLEKEFTALRLELSVKAKNGLDFIVAASIIWALIAFIWTLPYAPATNSLLTFLVGGLMLPLAWAFSKLLKTTWTIKGNPLQPLGLWLNFAQLFYFPFLLFVYGKHPEYFIMTYGIITGAHFFPYAWFYNVKAFAVLAGVISVGCLVVQLNVAREELYLIPAFMVGCLLVLALLLFLSFQKNRNLYHQAAPTAASYA